MHEVVSVGRLRIKDNDSGTVIDTEGLKAWFTPTLKYKMAGTRQLKSLGYGKSIGIDDEDYLVHRKSGDRIKLVEVGDVYTFRASGAQPRKEGDSLLKRCLSAPADTVDSATSLFSKLGSDWVWNAKIAEEEREDAAAAALATERAHRIKGSGRESGHQCL